MITSHDTATGNCCLGLFVGKNFFCVYYFCFSTSQAIIINFNLPTIYNNNNISHSEFPVVISFNGSKPGSDRYWTLKMQDLSLAFNSRTYFLTI